LSPAPDRHDIYPTGESNSKKAKNIFEVHNNLREQGFIKIWKFFEKLKIFPGTAETMVVKDASSTLIGRGMY